MATKATRPKGSNGELKLPKVREDVSAAKTIRAENVGPNRAFEDLFRPGLNFLCGANGSGKSTFQTFIAAASGAGLPVSVTDGEQVAKLIINDAQVFEYKRPKGEQPHLTLESVNTAALVVNPGIQDKDKAEEARLKHTMKLVHAETTEETIQFFLTPEPKEEGEEPSIDAEAYDYVDLKYGIERLTQLDPVMAADVLIKGKAGLIHTLKRDYRAKADNAQARYQVANPQKPAQLSKLGLDEADAEYRDAVGDHRQVQGEASQRAQLERQRAEIETTLGDEPDISALELSLSQRRSIHQARVDQVARLLSEMEDLKLRITEAQGEARRAHDAEEQAGEALRQGEQSHASWERRKKILDTSITGATAADVEKAAGRVALARSALDLARETAEYRKKLEVAETARKERDTANTRADEVEALAAGIPARLAEQFNRLGIPGSRVNEGVLEVKNEKGKWEPYWRRSVGQQWDWILPINAAHNPGSTMALPKAVLAELQREWVISNHETFLKHGITAIIEVTTFEGDPMHVVPFEEFIDRLPAA